MLQFVRLQRVGPVLVTEQEHHQQMQQTKQTENIISSQSAALSSNILRTYSFSHYILSKTQKKLNLEVEVTTGKIKEMRWMICDVSKYNHQHTEF